MAEFKPLIFWLQDGPSHHTSILPLPNLFPLSILRPFPYISPSLSVEQVNESYERQKADACLMLSEERPSKIIHSRAVTSSRKGHFRGGCLYTIEVLMLSAELHLVPPRLGGKLAC